jgi:hypothetical protein
VVDYGCLTQNDEFYLVTDTEGNIGIICFWNPIEVTDPQLLQRNMAKISLTRYLEYCEPYKENTSIGFQKHMMPMLPSVSVTR